MSTYASVTTDCPSLPSKLVISETLDITGCGCGLAVADKTWDQSLVKLSNYCRYTSPLNYKTNISGHFISARNDRDVNGIWTLTINCYDNSKNPILLWQGQRVSASPVGIYNKVSGCISLTTLQTTASISVVGSVAGVDPIISTYTLAVSGIVSNTRLNGIFKLTQDATGTYTVKPNAIWRLQQYGSNWVVSSNGCFTVCSDVYYRQVPILWKLVSVNPKGKYSLIPLDSCPEWDSSKINEFGGISITVS